MSDESEPTRVDGVKAAAEESVDRAKDAARTAAAKVEEAAAEVQPVARKQLGHAVSAAKKTDEALLRLNRLLANPGGLSAFLSTSNYILYILTYLQSKPPALARLANKLLALLRPGSTPVIVLNAATTPSPIAAFAALLSQTRTNLRLLGLFPLYTWFRALSAGPKPGADAVLHGIALTQCLSYITYQFLENISVLADHGIVSRKIIALLNRGDPTTARVYKWAYRAWFAGVSCDFVRLARELQIERQRRAMRRQVRDEGKANSEHEDEEEKAFEKRWWTDLMIGSAWFPMALHFSSDKGLPGWNLGIMGICGLVAGGGRTRALWRGTLQ